MPVFDANHGDISQDCLNVMYVTLNHQSEMDQKFIEGNVQGRAFKMPAGEARFSAGVHSRTNSYYYIFDPLQTENSFNDNPEGFPADNTKGETAVKELYGELLLPRVEGKSAGKHLNLELGYRYSDYDLQGGVGTYKALFDWGITDTLRFRGGRQLATRAPNIAELFQSNTQSWSVQFGGEPCATEQLGSRTAPIRRRNPNAAAVQALCSAIIGSVAAQYYSPTQQGQINPVVWLPFVDATGNPAVNPEEAKTLTAGIVWRPNSTHEKLNGLNLSVDYYDIKITDMISVEGALTVYEKCLSATSNPTFDPHQSSVREDPSQPGDRNRHDDDGLVRQRGVRASVGSRLHGGLARRSSRAAQFGVNFMVSSLLNEKTQDTVNATRGRLEGQPWPVLDHVVEQRRVRLPDLHDRQLRARRLEFGAALAPFADRHRRGPGCHQLQHQGGPGRPADPGSDARRGELVRRVRPVRRLHHGLTDHVCATESTICSTSCRCARVVAVPPRTRRRTRIRARAAARRKPASTTSWAEASTWA